MKNLIFLIFFAIAGMCLNAQTVNIHKKDGSVIRVPLKDFNYMDITHESGTTENFGGTWSVNANGHKGNLIIQQNGNNITGSIMSSTDKITGTILPDGSITFTRHSCNQVYTGSLVNGKLIGNFTWMGGNYKWEASR